MNAANAIRPRAGRAAVLLVLAILALSVPPALAGSAQPNPHVGPLLDGCQRSEAATLGLATPEWVYVGRKNVTKALAAGDPRHGMRTASGAVVGSRPSGEDLYVSHDLQDQNVTFVPDPADRGILAQGQGAVEAELEAGKVPLWAMPQVGDRVTMSGAWIWDCGHWGNSAADSTGLSQLLPFDPVETLRDLLSPGAIRGEETELHPWTELATFRANAAGRLNGRRLATRMSRLDVWINGDGGPALATEECALAGIGNMALARELCPQTRDVGGVYRYVLPLGPRPSSTARIAVNPVAVHPETHPDVAHVPVLVVPDEAAGTVTVSFTLPHSVKPQPFGITVEAAWSGAAQAVRHRVTLDSIHITASLDGPTEPNLNPANNGPEQTPDPGEWALYANVSGQWVKLPVTEVRSGQTIPLGITFDFWLPAGVTPTLFVSGHECDEPIITCTDEGFGRVPDRTHPSTELGFNDRPGRIQLLVDHSGVPLTRGTAVYAPPPNPFGGGDEDFSDPTCGASGCYQITATWQTT